MSVIGSNALAGASGQGGGAGYEIERSLRFNPGDSASLTKAFSATGSQTTYTLSFWLKKNNSSSVYQTILIDNNSTGNQIRINDLPGGFQLRFAAASGADLTTSRKFRDPSAWYHIVLVYDSTNATSSDRMRIYINGVRETNFSGENQPSQNLASSFITNGHTYTIGYYNASTALDGYLADVHFIDGQALAASDFGQYDSNSVWQPIEYAGTYGTNGFHLDFSDTSSNAALGTDSSGNSNTWTVNNLNVAAGAGNDSFRDSPTNGTQTDTGVGGEVAGNYATLNPLDHSGTVQPTFRDGNLICTGPSAWTTVYSTMPYPESGKWYFETTLKSDYARVNYYHVAGFCPIGTGSYADNIVSLFDAGDLYEYGPGGSPTTTLFSAGTVVLEDVVGWAVDIDNWTYSVYINGTISSINNRAIPFTVGTQLTPAVVSYNMDYGHFVYNFGATPFANTAPSGYKCLCTANLPEPTIADGSTAFDAKTFTANNGTQTISGFNFSPDLIWTKSRANAYAHQLWDQVRGTNKALSPNDTSAEANLNNSLAFTSDGFTSGTNNNANYGSGGSIAWAWDAGSSNTTIAAGSISSGVPSIASTVRANPSAGFSIVSYSGNPAGAKTIAHGLSAKPNLIIVKNRTLGVFDWPVYHNSLGVGSNTSLKLNTTDAATHNYFPTEPTSSVFYTTSSGAVGGGASDDMIAYCFAPVEGYSKFGSYTGNGSADGPFVYTGFKTRWVMMKASSHAGSWVMYDTTRDTASSGEGWLYANSTSSEQAAATYAVHTTSNGFRMAGTSNENNGSGRTYIYAAFAEHPFKTSRAR